MSDTRLTDAEVVEIEYRAYRWHEFGDAGDGGIHRIGWDRESLLTDRRSLLADLASATATIADRQAWIDGYLIERESFIATGQEYVHRADAAEGEAAVWRDKAEEEHDRGISAYIESQKCLAVAELKASILDRDLASERTARRAVDGREAGLMEALTRFGTHEHTCDYFDTWLQPQPKPCNCGLAAALATPANGAGDVLMAALALNKLFDSYEGKPVTDESVHEHAQAVRLVIAKTAAWQKREGGTDATP